jgi:DNA primase (bacterial type)
MAVSLSDIRDHLENCHDYSGYLAAICPFHSDNKPSLMVYPDGYRCVACGAHGSLEYLLSKISGGYYVSHTQDISPDWYKWLSDVDLRGFSKQAHSYLKRHVECQLYLNRRGIGEMIDEVRLGFWSGYYIFPIFNENGSVVNLVARTGETLQDLTGNRYFDCPYSITGNHATLYVASFELLEKSPYIVVVYGIIDMLSLAILNIPSVTFSAGKVIPPSFFDQWRKIIYVIGDKGEERDAKRLAQELGWRGRFINLSYPDGCKDINDVHVKYGADKVLQIVNDITQQDIHSFSLEAF